MEGCIRLDFAGYTSRSGPIGACWSAGGDRTDSAAAHDRVDDVPDEQRHADRRRVSTPLRDSRAAPTRRIHACVLPALRVRGVRRCGGFRTETGSSPVPLAAFPAITVRARRSISSEPSTARRFGRGNVCRWPEETGDTSVMFLVHPTLTTAEIDATCMAVQGSSARPPRGLDRRLWPGEHPRVPQRIQATQHRRGARPDGGRIAAGHQDHLAGCRPFRSRHAATRCIRYARRSMTFVLRQRSKSSASASACRCWLHRGEEGRLPETRLDPGSRSGSAPPAP